MVKLHHRDLSWQVLRKDQYWVRFFFLFYNDLPNGLISNAKLFADDTSLFTIVKDKNESANDLNNDLSLISRWAYDWKMLFNPDPKKPAQEVIFSRKKQSQNHPTISLNNIHVERATYQNTYE